MNYEKKDHAKVTCRDCGFSWTKNCSVGYRAEREFYLKYKPACPDCGGSDWDIREIIEAVRPLRDFEKDLFSLVLSTEATRHE